MDLEDEEWVSVPYDGLLEAHDDGDDKIFSRKYAKSPTIFEKQFDHKEEAKEIIKLPILIMEPKETSFEPEPELDQDQDPVFKVFFKKENQFVEMKMGSPRLSSQEFDLCRTERDSFQYEEKNDDNCSSSPKMIKKEVVSWKENNEKFMNVLKWGLNGIGGFCSLGMAAATICIIIYVNGRRHKQQKKLKLQIYPENKRIKQVVQKANEAMSSVRGVPLVNAQIRNSEAATNLRSESNRKSSPEKEDKLYTAAAAAEKPKICFAGGGGGGGVVDESGCKSKHVWPKVYIALSNKEKEEDFMAMKGCKPSHRPKKRAKMIQRTILLVSPGAWLSDMCQERYEVREKKNTKKRPTGLKAMGSMESDSD